MVAPITLDTHSAAQRTDASETVHAYCQDHSLQLCALIVLPATSPARCSPGVLEHTNLPIKATPEDGLAFAMWEEDVESASWEPLTTMRDYFDLLMRASGRVILMSRCLPYSKSSDLLQWAPLLIHSSRSRWHRTTLRWDAGVSSHEPKPETEASRSPGVLADHRCTWRFWTMFAQGQW